MRRRCLLATISGSFLPGCLNGASDTLGAKSGDADKADTTSETCFDGLVLSDVRPREIERAYIDYEYVEVTNTSERPIDVKDVTILYGADHKYAFPDLSLEPGGKAVVLTRAGEETVLATYPPVHILSAGFGEEQQASVLDGSGVVYLESPSGATLYEKYYSEDGTTGGE